MSEISFSITSAGYKHGNSFSISYNNKQVAFSGSNTRGLNVAVFDQTNGSLISANSYDTNGDGSASETFAKMVEPLCIGRIVVVAGNCCNRSLLSFSEGRSY
jgi:hypothetical protein